MRKRLSFSGVRRKLRLTVFLLNYLLEPILTWQQARGVNVCSESFQGCEDMSFCKLPTEKNRCKDYRRLAWGVMGEGKGVARIWFRKGGGTHFGAPPLPPGYALRNIGSTQNILSLELLPDSQFVPSLCLLVCDCRLVTCEARVLCME